MATSRLGDPIWKDLAAHAALQEILREVAVDLALGELLVPLGFLVDDALHHPQEFALERFRIVLSRGPGDGATRL